MNRRSFVALLALATLAARSSQAGARGDGMAVTFGELPAGGSIGKIFAAGSPAAVLTCVLAPDKLLGWPMQLDDAARALLPPSAAARPFLGRLSGRGSTVSTETLLSLQPDLVLDAGSVNPLHQSGAERVWQQTGLPYLLIDGRLRDHPAQLRDVGRLVGVSERGQELADLATRILELVDTVMAANHGEAAPRVYYARGPDGLETGLGGSINMEAIELAGADNVAAQAGRGGLTRVSMEQILAWNPQVLLTQDAGFARRVRDDRLWRSVSAVRQGRVHIAPVLPFGWLDGPPGVNRIIGLPWLLRRLYPRWRPELGAEHIDGLTALAFERFYGQRMPAALLADVPARST